MTAGNCIQHFSQGAKLVILSFALFVAVLYVNKFIRWRNYVSTVCIKAEGLFDKYTVSWRGGMGVLHTNVRTSWKGTSLKQCELCTGFVWSRIWSIRWLLWLGNFLSSWETMSFLIGLLFQSNYVTWQSITLCQKIRLQRTEFCFVLFPRRLCNFCTMCVLLFLL
jgi:hypothetical protein